MNQRLPLAFYTGFLLIVMAPLAMAQKPVVTLSTTSLNFGTAEAGTMTVAQVITLTNTGTAALNITQLSAGSAYQVFNDCPATVNAGASCTFGVVFQPQTAGSF